MIWYVVLIIMRKRMLNNIKIKGMFKKSLKKYTKITVKHNSSLFIWYNIDKKNGDKLC